MKSFSQKVIAAVKKIPRGQVRTYKEVATAAGNPKACRAVGQILSRNPRLIKVPCHRVVRSDLKVGGYANGVKKKIALLKKEGIKIKRGRVMLG